MDCALGADGYCKTGRRIERRPRNTRSRQSSLSRAFVRSDGATLDGIKAYTSLLQKVAAKASSAAWAKKMIDVKMLDTLAQCFSSKLVPFAETKQGRMLDPKDTLLYDSMDALLCAAEHFPKQISLICVNHLDAFASLIISRECHIESQELAADLINLILRHEPRKCKTAIATVAPPRERSHRMRNGICPTLLHRAESLLRHASSFGLQLRIIDMLVGLGAGASATLVNVFGAGHGLRHDANFVRNATKALIAFNTRNATRIVSLVGTLVGFFGAHIPPEAKFNAEIHLGHTILQGSACGKNGQELPFKFSYDNTWSVNVKWHATGSESPRIVVEIFFDLYKVREAVGPEAKDNVIRLASAMADVEELRRRCLPYLPARVSQRDEVAQRYSTVKDATSARDKPAPQHAERRDMRSQAASGTDQDSRLSERRAKFPSFEKIVHLKNAKEDAAEQTKARNCTEAPISSSAPATAAIALRESRPAVGKRIASNSAPSPKAIKRTKPLTAIALRHAEREHADEESASADCQLLLDAETAGNGSIDGDELTEKLQHQKAQPSNVASPCSAFAECERRKSILQKKTAIKPDNNAKGANGWIVYLRSRRAFIERLHPGLRFQGVQKLVSAEWAGMTEMEKKQWTDRTCGTAEDKVQHAAPAVVQFTKPPVSQRNQGARKSITIRVAREEEVCQAVESLHVVHGEYCDSLTKGTQAQQSEELQVHADKTSGVGPNDYVGAAPLAAGHAATACYHQNLAPGTKERNLGSVPVVQESHGAAREMEQAYAAKASAAISSSKACSHRRVSGAVAKAVKEVDALCNRIDQASRARQFSVASAVRARGRKEIKQRASDAKSEMDSVQLHTSEDSLHHHQQYKRLDTAWNTLIASHEQLSVLRQRTSKASVNLINKIEALRELKQHSVQQRLEEISAQLAMQQHRSRSKIARESKKLNNGGNALQNLVKDLDAVMELSHFGDDSQSE